MQIACSSCDKGIRQRTDTRWRRFCELLELYQTRVFTEEEQREWREVCLGSLEELRHMATTGNGCGCWRCPPPFPEKTVLQSACVLFHDHERDGRVMVKDPTRLLAGGWIRRNPPCSKCVASHALSTQCANKEGACVFCVMVNTHHPSRLAVPVLLAAYFPSVLQRVISDYLPVIADDESSDSDDG